MPRPDATKWFVHFLVPITSKPLVFVPFNFLPFSESVIVSVIVLSNQRRFTVLPDWVQVPRDPPDQVISCFVSSLVKVTVPCSSALPVGPNAHVHVPTTDSSVADDEDSPQ